MNRSNVLRGLAGAAAVGGGLPALGRIAGASSSDAAVTVLLDEPIGTFREHLSQ
jgi:hypothetical protein